MKLVRCSGLVLLSIAMAMVPVPVLLPSVPEPELVPPPPLQIFLGCFHEKSANRKRIINATVVSDFVGNKDRIRPRAAIYWEEELCWRVAGNKLFMIRSQSWFDFHRSLPSCYSAHTGTE